MVEFGYYTPSWGNLVLLEHALPDHTRVWSQYAHLDQIQVIVASQQTDREAGTFRKARVDHWYSAPYGYHGTMLWTYASAETEANWAEWRPVLPSAGQWEVGVYIPEQQATTAQAHYKIVHAGGKADVVINQNDYHNEWVRLGTYRFEPRQGYVRLSDVTGERRRGIMVGFDAARWVKVEDERDTE